MKKVLNRSKSLKYLHWFRFTCIFNSIEESVNDNNQWKNLTKDLITDRILTK